MNDCEEYRIYEHRMQNDQNEFHNACIFLLVCQGICFILQNKTIVSVENILSPCV